VPGSSTQTGSCVAGSLNHIDRSISMLRVKTRLFLRTMTGLPSLNCFQMDDISLSSLSDLKAEVVGNGLAISDVLAALRVYMMFSCVNNKMSQS
jgi:hypothetical protein